MSMPIISLTFLVKCWNYNGPVDVVTDAARRNHRCGHCGRSDDFLKSAKVYMCFNQAGETVSVNAVTSGWRVRRTGLYVVSAQIPTNRTVKLTDDL